MTPGVSAGSNHVGARETWTAIVSWPAGASERPSGAAAASVATGGSAATVRASRSASARDERRTLTVSSVLSIDSVACRRDRGAPRRRSIHRGPFIIRSMKTAEILADAKSLLEDTIQLRRRIHRHPEVGLTVPRTQATVLEALEGLGLDVRTGQRTTSIVARLTGARPGPTILLRADMDALPMPEETGLPFASEVDGRMHACGHDAHTAMLVGAARLLVRRRDSLAGSVLFMLQPGEEGYHGARVMIEEGLLDGTSAPSGAFALHVTHRMEAGSISARPGPAMASGDTLQIVVRGKGGHASAPHDCLDPIPIACEIVQAFQTLVTRRVHVFDPAVVTVAKIEAGTTRNVIPDTASLLGTIRTVSEATRERVLEGVRRVAEGVAAAHGAEVAVELIRGYAVLDTARELLGPEAAHATSHPIMASEDFSYV